ncbi:MAG: DUF3108 domain-containing protein [Xanthobacteraceae bacterium]
MFHSASRCAIATLLLAAMPGFAQAQGTLEARYTISLARIPIGTASATADIVDGRYRLTVSGRASGMLRVIASGEGSLTASGAMIDGRPSPAEFVARTTTDDDTLDVRLGFDGGNVTALAASAPPPGPDRIKLTEAHRVGVLDPLTALLIPAGADGSGPSEASCNRTLPVFDGRRRYDLMLAHKRMDTVKADKGYSGSVVVCAVTLKPIAGYRKSSRLVKFLTDGRDIEIALAPVAGTRMLAPFRVSVANMLGNLMVHASRFEVLAPSSQRASATTGQAQ